MCPEQIMMERKDFVPIKFENIDDTCMNTYYEVIRDMQRNGTIQPSWHTTIIGSMRPVERSVSAIFYEMMLHLSWTERNSRISNPLFYSIADIRTRDMAVVMTYDRTNLINQQIAQYLKEFFDQVADLWDKYGDEIVTYNLPEFEVANYQVVTLIRTGVMAGKAPNITMIDCPALVKKQHNTCVNAEQYAFDPYIPSRLRDAVLLGNEQINLSIASNMLKGLGDGGYCILIPD